MAATVINGRRTFAVAVRDGADLFRVSDKRSANLSVPQNAPKTGDSTPARAPQADSPIVTSGDNDRASIDQAQGDGAGGADPQPT